MMHIEMSSQLQRLLQEPRQRHPLFMKPAIGKLSETVSASPSTSGDGSADGVDPVELVSEVGVEPVHPLGQRTEQRAPYLLNSFSSGVCVFAAMIMIDLEVIDREGRRVMRGRTDVRRMKGATNRMRSVATRTARGGDTGGASRPRIAVRKMKDSIVDCLPAHSARSTVRRASSGCTVLTWREYCCCYIPFRRIKRMKGEPRKVWSQPDNGI